MSIKSGGPELSWCPHQAGRGTESPLHITSIGLLTLVVVLPFLGVRLHASLLLAGPDLERYLPGMLFDYLAARRPVLVFGSRGESAALVDRLGAGVFCPSGSGALLREALARIQGLDMSRTSDTVNAWLEEHRREALAEDASYGCASMMAE